MFFGEKTFRRILKISNLFVLIPQRVAGENNLHFWRKISSAEVAEMSMKIFKSNFVLKGPIYIGKEYNPYALATFENGNVEREIG